MENGGSMTDARKVRPVAPLDAERDPGFDEVWPWFIRLGPDTVVQFDDAEFAAAFMPAELIDDIIAAARAWEQNVNIDTLIETGYSHKLAVAVRRYDTFTEE